MIGQLLLLIIVLLISFCSDTYAENNCKFLGQINEDLWIIDGDGKSVQPIATVGIMKAAVTWSPDGEYIAYSTSNPVGEEQAIIIVDNAGRQVAKIIVEPKREHWEIRYIDRLVWRTADTLWSYSSAGKNGGYIDIWKLAPTLSRPAKHKKRIKVFNGNCELSPNNKYMACNSSIYDVMSFEISDTDKKEYPDASYYFDRKPRKIKLKNAAGSIRDIRFTADSDIIILTNGGVKYKYSMSESKLSEIKELRPGITIKNFPEEIELKSDEKHKAKVFDMYCD
jgi:hypothetical protein